MLWLGVCVLLLFISPFFVLSFVPICVLFPALHMMMMLTPVCGRLNLLYLCSLLAAGVQQASSKLEEYRRAQEVGL
jgi:hypothetical protein